MTDITKCPGKRSKGGSYEICEDRDECYRFTSESGEFQSWACYWRASRERLGLSDCFLHQGDDDE